MQGDVVHNMCPIPAVCQRIFNELIQMYRFSDHFGENCVILLQMVAK